MNEVKPTPDVYEQAQAAFYQSSTPVQNVIDVAFAAGVAAERARIVVGLRELAEAPGGINSGNAYLQGIADLIERGEL